jgi:hypothetical protein
MSGLGRLSAQPSGVASELVRETGSLARNVHETIAKTVDMDAFGGFSEPFFTIQTARPEVVERSHYVVTHAA